MSEGFDLGLPEPTRKEREPVEGVRWSKVNPRVKHLCDDCMDETPTVNGVPIHVITPAFYVRHDGGLPAYYCAPHGQARKQAEKE